MSFVHEEAGYAMAELETCEAWDPQFGRPETEYIAPIECPDGSTEYLMLLRSGVPLPMGKGGVHLFEEMANIQHRWKLRADAIKDGWQCVGGGDVE